MFFSKQDYFEIYCGRFVKNWKNVMFTLGGVANSSNSARWWKI